MAFAALTARQKQILKALIDLYVETAEPVGSRVLAERCKVGLSPASVRNILKELEERGYLTQPHTSAGRVPTDLAYRSYVDHLLTPETLPETEQNLIREKIKGDYTDVESVLDRASQLLGSLSNQLGVTIAPQLTSAILVRVELIPVADKRLLVVLVLQSKHVKSLILEVEADLSDLAIGETVRVLNERLCGLSLGEIKSTIDMRLRETTSGDPTLMRLFVDNAGEIWSFVDVKQMHVAGAANLFQHPEFRDQREMAEIVALIDDKQTMCQLLLQMGGHGLPQRQERVHITIGHENVFGRGDRLSFLTSQYDAGGSKGIMAIIGPTRMNYSRLVALIDYTSKTLSYLLSDRA